MGRAPDSSVTGVLTGRPCEDRGTQGKCCATRRQGDGKQPPAEECGRHRKPPEARERQGRTPLWLSVEERPRQAGFQSSRLQNCETTHFCCCKSPSLLGQPLEC